MTYHAFALALRIQSCDVRQRARNLYGVVELHGLLILAPQNGRGGDAAPAARVCRHNAQMHEPLLNILIEVVLSK